jgi:AraC-like DNA-binding protein
MTAGGDESGPVVVGANWYRFRPAEYLVNPHVMSVSFIWVLRGGGSVKSGNQTFRLGPNDVVRLPWSHKVEYQADSQNPFLIGTLHVVPRHLFSSSVVPRVAHLPKDPLLNDPARSGDHFEFQPSLANFSNGPARRIADLGRFAVERFTDSAFNEELFRALAKIVLLENSQWEDGADFPSIPPALEAMMAFVRSNLGSPLSVAKIAKIGDVSPTSAQRLFNSHTGSSIGIWVRGRRLQMAAHLLRSSGLRVNEIGKLVGFDDPLYFSRVFSAEYGVPPSKFGHGELRP